jgi:hypothetical protein
MFSSAMGEAGKGSVTLDDAGRLEWTSDSREERPWLQLDFTEMRDLGGLTIDWDKDDFASAYELARSDDGAQWETIASVEGSAGGRRYLPLPDADARQLRLRVRTASRGQGVRLHGLRVMGPEFAESPNNMYATIASEAPRGWFPRYFLKQQQTWTVVGVDEDEKEALLDADGAIEVDKAGFRLEPFLFVQGRLITWAEVKPQPSLADDCLPIPSVAWDAGDLELQTTALADGTAGDSTLLARYCVHNRGAERQQGSFYIALRPFQVLTPWQELNITGGVSKIREIRWDGAQALVNAQKAVRPWTAPTAFGAASFVQGDIAAWLSTGTLPTPQSLTDSSGFASAALRYDFDLAAGERQSFVVSVPFHAAPAGRAAEIPAGEVEPRYSEILGRVREFWSGQVNRAQLSLPHKAARLTNTFKSMQAFILINADGPALQPGSRTYERSWIRDGASIGVALLWTGHADKVRTYLDWYCTYQFPGGKVPCVVDRRGPDPVPEHDSTGELIYLLLKYYQFSRDRAFLERHLPNVVAGVEYIEKLRQERLTDAYRDGPPEMRACYGLVPASISHEGYSAKPMHSYWDNFWLVRGLRDAVTIARILDRPDLEQRWRALADAYRTSLADSIRLAMQNKNIDFIPGCAELGDFDATSTAIAVFPCAATDTLPEAALTRTFERYYEFFSQRRAGTFTWENYTPYELRIASTLLRLDQPRRANELLDFFLADQRPPAWDQWAEVVWRDPATPAFIGDMPHTWVGAEFLTAFRSLFVYEREADGALVLAAGVRPEWLASPEGVAIVNWPTEYGKMSYSLRSQDGQIRLMLTGDGEVPPGGVVFKVPGDQAIRSVRVDGNPTDAFSGRDVQLRTVRGAVVVTLAP